MNSIPGQEQFNYWHSSQANIEGSKNFAGAENKIIDNLVEKISTSKSIDEIEYLAKALDRVLLWQYYVIPHWYLDKFRIIYWNKFKRPDTIPTYSLGLFNWWSSEN